MSITGKDKEVLYKGRKKVAPVTSLRDQISKKLYRTLEKEGLLNKLSKAWHTANADMATFLEKQQIYLQELDSFTPADAEQPFSQSSNLHIPMQFIVCKTYHARFMQALLGVDPPFSTKARREDSVEQVPLAEDFLRYTINDWSNRNRGLRSQVDTWLWNWITTGTGVLKTRWLTEWERFTDVELVKKPTAPIVQQDRDGSQVLVPQWTQEEEEVIKTIKTFSGPMGEYVQLEDFMMVGGGGDPDLADMVFHRSYVTSSQLYTWADQGVFDHDAVDLVIEAGRTRKTSASYASIKQQRAINSGKASVETEADLDRYEIFETCLKYDVDGNGILSEVVCWFSKEVALLGATYLRRLIPSGQRPYAVIHFHKRPDQEHGVGLPEILHPLAKELDAMHNIRIDTGLLTNMPFFFYRPMGGMDAETIQFEPGTGIPLDNPQTDVYFPSIENKTAFTGQEEQVIQTYIERLTGVSDLSLGVMSGTQGASRTASGVKALLGESNSNLDVHLQRLNEGWKKVLHLLYTLIRTRVEPDFVFRITGQDGKSIFKTVNANELPDVDFELTANSSNSNKQVQVEVNQQVMQLTMNPLNIQMGVCGPDQIYEAQKTYLQSIGVRDYHRYLKQPQPDTYILSAQDEFQRVVRGQDTPVSLRADHDAFIAFTQHMLDEQKNTQILTQDQVMASISQMKKHMQMKQALEQQAAQQAMSQQMQTNAAQSSQQTVPMGPGQQQAQPSPGSLPV